MKCKFLIIITLLISINNSFSQIRIDSSDMPNVGDNYKMLIANNIGAVNYQAAGSNITWDFSSWISSLSRNDTFFTVASTPYAAFFSNVMDPLRKATISSFMTDGEFPIPSAYSVMINISEGFDYFKQTQFNYSQVGIAATIYLPLMDTTYYPEIKFNAPDVIYKFPLEIGDNDTSRINFMVNLNYGQMFENRVRINTVDGWGTLITPYNTFEVLRLKTDIYRHDSLSIRYYALVIDTAFNTIHTEYKWLTKTYGMPVAMVRTTTNGDGIVTRATFIDSIPDPHFGIKDIVSDYSIFPNPAKDYIDINILNSGNQIKVDLFDVNLCNILSLKNNAIINKKIRIDIRNINLKSGVYFIRINDGSNSIMKKVLILR